MKSFQEIEQTGEWWLQEGWHKCDSFRRDKYSPEDIALAIETLKPIFTAEWFRDSLKKHVQNMIIAQLIYIGPPSNDFLVEMSRMFRSLNKVDGFMPVCERLKGDQSRGAFFEIEMASAFSSRNIQVELPRRGKDKSPDVIVHFPDQSVAIECKHLEKEKWEIWMEKLHSEVHWAVTSIRPDRKFKIQLQLDPTLSDIHFDPDNEPVVNEAIYKAILTNIKNMVNEILDTSNLPVNFEIPSLVAGTIFPADANVEETTIGAHISTTAKLRRIFNNGFFRAEKQLPKEMPGIVAVYSDYLPDPPFARIIFDAITGAERERLKHIVALLIFPLQTILHWTPPLLFENKYSSERFDSLKCASIIKDSFGV
jgi:hypothetical protein